MPMMVGRVIITIFLLLLARSPERLLSSVQDHENSRCRIAKKRGQTQQAQTPYTVPSDTSAKAADGEQYSRLEIQKAQDPLIAYV